MTTNSPAVHYYIAVDTDGMTILAGAHTGDHAFRLARNAGGPATGITIMDCTKELFELVQQGPTAVMQWDPRGDLADVIVHKHEVDEVVDFVKERMIHAADRGKLIVESPGAADELRPYAVPLHPDMASWQERYRVVELLQSTALHRFAIAELDSWIVANSEREWELVGMESGKVYGPIIARNAQHAHAAGEHIDAGEDLEARLVAEEE